jgi:ATP-binding cassette, subfamily B, bacterial
MITWDRLRRQAAQAGEHRRVPVLLQLTAVECGAACLAMILSAFGRSTRVAECRAAMGPGQDGVTALAIVQAARGLGLEAKAYRLAPEQLRDIPMPTIAHWGDNHFVVLERCTPRWVDIVDPASGRRRITPQELAAELSGVVLTFVPGPHFVPRSMPLHASWSAELRRLLRLPGIRRLLAAIVVASLLLQVLGLALPLFVALLVDRILPDQALGLLPLLGAGMLLVVVAEALLSLGRAVLLTSLQMRLDRALMHRFLQHLLALPFRFFQERTSGDLLMRLTSNATIRETLTSQVLASLLDGGLILVYLTIILLRAPLFGAVVCAIGLLQALVLVVVAPRLRSLSEQDLQAQSDEESYLVELLGGIATIKAAGGETRVLASWSRLFARALHIGQQRSLLAARVEAAIAALRTLAPLLLLWIGARAVLEGSIDAGIMLALVVLAINALAPLGSLMAQLQQLQLVRVHLDRLVDVIEAAPEQDAQAVEPAPALTGRIELEQVDFRYAPHGPLVLGDLNVSIAPGQLVAVVGRTGSGKSTLVRLLLGLVTPAHGRIMYDGLPLHTLDYGSVRSQVGVVLQDVFLFSGTIRQNIAGHLSDADDEQVVAAARMAAIHDEIMRMPMQYASRVAEGGAGLSGGQRQRIALARALAGRPALLLLDEATSHLDAVTEQQIEANLRALSCTRIVVAHRLSTVRHADLILVLDQGRLVEQGTHAELLARQGAYAALVQGQLSSGIAV